MQFIRAFLFACWVFLCATIVLIGEVRPSHAGEENSLIGRWQVDHQRGSGRANDDFTMDILSCGTEICGIWVKNGRCRDVVFARYELLKTTVSKDDPRGPTYVYYRLDLKEEFVVFKTGVIDANRFRLYGENRLLAERGGLTDLLWRRHYPMDVSFKRIGPAQCAPPATWQDGG